MRGVYAERGCVFCRLAQIKDDFAGIFERGKESTFVGLSLPRCVLFSLCDVLGLTEARESS